MCFDDLERSHQGYRRKGRTPAQALREALNLTVLPPAVPEADEDTPEAVRTTAFRSARVSDKYETGTFVAVLLIPISR